MKTRFPIGLKYNDYTVKHNHERKIVDILTTSNSKGEVIKVEYQTSHVFLGQDIMGLATDTRIARSLPSEELGKYL